MLGSFLKANKQKIFFLLLSILIFLTVLLYFFGTDLAITWNTATLLQTKKVILDTFTKGLFNITPEGEVFYIQKKYLSEYLHIPLYFYSVWTGVLALVLVILGSISSYLPRYKFLLAQFIFIVFFISFRFDLLELSGRHDFLYTGILIFLFSGLAYYFNNFGKRFSLKIRLLAFLLIIFGSGVSVFLLSRPANPEVYLANFGALVPILVSVIFIALVSAQIPFAFLYLINTYNPLQSKSNLKHFSVVTWIYLINLILLFLKNTKTYELDIFYLNAFLVLSLSILIGMWGSAFQPSFLKIFPVHRRLGYLTLGIVTLVTLGFAFLTANDPLIEMFEDIILYTHIGFGISFFIYVLFNFNQILNSTSKVHLVLYKNQDQVKLPNYIIRAVGFLCLVGILLFVNLFPYYQGLSGYYNGIGEVYRTENEIITSKLYYQKARSYAFQNHRSNHVLAALSAASGSAEEEIAYLKMSLAKRPTPQAYVLLSECLNDLEMSLDALFVLQEGVRQFPENYHILNNIAVAFHENNIADSARIYSLRAEEAHHDAMHQINQLSHQIQFDYDETLDIKNNDQKGILVNQVALSIIRDRTPPTFRNNIIPYFSVNEPIAKLDIQSYAYLYDHVFAKIHDEDSTGFLRMIAYEKNPYNLYNFGESFQFLKACKYYYQGNVAQGIEYLQGITLGSSNAYYHKVLGIWFLENNVFEKALFHLQTARELGDQEAPYYLIAAHAENKDWAKAHLLAEKILEEEGNIPAYLRNSVTVIQKISTGSKPLESDSDQESFAYLYYKIKQLVNPSDLYEKIREPNFKAWGAACLALYYLEKNNLAEAEELLRSINTENLNPFVLSQYYLAKTALLYKQKKFEEIITSAQDFSFVDRQLYFCYFYLACAHQELGHPDEAQTYYENALGGLPYEEKVILKAASFFNHIQDIERAYFILLNGTRAMPENIKIGKAYALQCLDMRVESFGQDALDRLKTLTDQSDFNQFKTIYTQKKALLEKQDYL